MTNVGLLSHYSLVGTCDGHCVGAVAPCSPEPFLQHWILHFAIGIGTALIFCHIVPPIHPICAWYSPIIVVPCILHFVVCWLGTIVGCPKNLGIPDITFQTESHLSMIFALGPTFSLFLGVGHWVGAIAAWFTWRTIFAALDLSMFTWTYFCWIGEGILHLLLALALHRYPPRGLLIDSAGKCNIFLSITKQLKILWIVNWQCDTPFLHNR